MRILAAILLVFAVSCGGSPTAPTCQVIHHDAVTTQGVNLFNGVPTLISHTAPAYDEVKCP